MAVAGEKLEVSMFESSEGDGKDATRGRRLVMTYLRVYGDIW